MPIYVRLQIEKENIFIDISGTHAISVSWEEKAKHLLGSKADISEFEDAIRYWLIACFSSCLLLLNLFRVLMLQT